MTKKTSSVKGSKRDAGREDRLKAALKANLQRRKQQSRARVSDDKTQSKA